MVGFLTPIGIGTDKTSAEFFSSMAKDERIKCFIAFENRRGWLFADVHHEDQPTVIVLSGVERRFEAFKFGVKLSALPDAPGGPKLRQLTAKDCLKINPNTGTVPIFRSERDGAITVAIYTRLPVYVDRSGDGETAAWPVKYSTKFHMTNASGSFRTKDRLSEEESAFPVGCRSWNGKLDWMPLYEGKMVSNFNHRFASVGINPNNVSGQGVSIHATETELADPTFCNQPRYWVAKAEVDWPYAYALGFNDICNTNNKRSLIAALVPAAAYGNKLPVL